MLCAVSLALDPKVPASVQAGLTYWGSILQATSEMGRQGFYVHHVCWKEAIDPDVLQVCSRTGLC